MEIDTQNLDSLFDFMETTDSDIDVFIAAYDMLFNQPDNDQFVKTLDYLKQKK